VATLVDMPKPC